MRLHEGGKFGQSGYELVLAVFLSFFLHAALVALTLFVVFATRPKIYVPPFYQVKLVGLPASTSPLPSSAGAAASPSPSPAGAAASPLPKPETASVKAIAKPQAQKPTSHPAKASPKKEVMPEFSMKKPKIASRAPATEETKSVQPATAPSAASQSGKAGGRTGGGARIGGGAGTEGVAVSSSSEDFKFPPYLALVRDKIAQNWNPPPGALGAKVKVEFTVTRSGRVGEAKLQASSGNFYFDQAAIRAILMSSPLPPMPEGFYKEYAVFTVDLQEKE